MTISAQTLLLALAGGVLPVLAWLWFWLREDKAKPEPRWILTITFIGGAVATMISYAGQVGVASIYGHTIGAPISANNIIPILVWWAAIEEIAKYSLAYFTALRRKCADEPIDMIIYMLVSALGFAALENALFLIEPLSSGQITLSIFTGNIRFIGATLLHTISSASIGIAMAMTFYKNASIKRMATILGLVIAVGLHALFNLFIINSNSNTELAVYAVVWFLIVVVILFFEKIKKIYPRT